jgi:hypothetical protein
MKRAADDVVYWIKQREAIRGLHDVGVPRPWTMDPILAKYRFCNVRREDDRVTQWLKNNWRDPYHGHPNLTVAMVLARMINWPPTLEAIGFPEVWRPKTIVERLEDLAAYGEKVWTGAYVVTTCGQRIGKAQYVVETVCSAVVHGRVRPVRGDSLKAFWSRLRAIPGLGAGFLAGQVVADLKNTDCPLADAMDWWAWACPGPGSLRGLSRYHGHTVSRGMFDEKLAAVAHDCERRILPLHLHAQDWQNVMCEMDKYWRTRDDGKRPRTLYSPETRFTP